MYEIIDSQRFSEQGNFNWIVGNMSVDGLALLGVRTYIYIQDWYLIINPRRQDVLLMYMTIDDMENIVYVLALELLFFLAATLSSQGTVSISYILLWDFVKSQTCEVACSADNITLKFGRSLSCWDAYQISEWLENFTHWSCTSWVFDPPISYQMWYENNPQIPHRCKESEGVHNSEINKFVQNMYTPSKGKCEIGSFTSWTTLQ